MSRHKFGSSVVADNYGKSYEVKIEQTFNAPAGERAVGEVLEQIQLEREKLVRQMMLDPADLHQPQSGYTARSASEEFLNQWAKGFGSSVPPPKFGTPLTSELEERGRKFREEVLAQATVAVAAELQAQVNATLRDFIEDEIKVLEGITRGDADPGALRKHLAGLRALVATIPPRPNR